MSENLEQLTARLRSDPGFARVTVARNGTNLKDWLPPLSKAEVAKAVQIARAALPAATLKTPQAERPLSRREREAKAAAERWDARMAEHAETERQRDEARRAAARLDRQRRLCRWFGWHQWAGCQCQACGAKRDRDHTWVGCRCSACRQTRDAEHAWAACQCTVCLAVRDVEHAWSGCICTRCHTSRDQDHVWEGCTCTACHKHRDQDHVWRPRTEAERRMWLPRNDPYSLEKQRHEYEVVCDRCGAQTWKPRYASRECYFCKGSLVGASFVACKRCGTVWHSGCGQGSGPGNWEVTIPCPKCGAH